MKCLMCRMNAVVSRTLEEYEKSECATCQNRDKFEEKADEDIAADGMEIFKNKMAMKQYASYLNDSEAQRRLLEDCINEARLSYETAKRFMEGI